MNYSEFINKLRAIENATGLYLSDMCVDAENAGSDQSDKNLVSVAIDAAGMRAEEAGYDINDLLGFRAY